MISILPNENDRLRHTSKRRLRTGIVLLTLGLSVTVIAVIGMQRTSHRDYWIDGVRYRLEYTQDKDHFRQWVRDSGDQSCPHGEETIGPNEYPEYCKLTADDAAAADRWEAAGEPEQPASTHIAHVRPTVPTVRPVRAHKPSRAHSKDLEFPWNGGDYYKDASLRWRKDSPECNEESSDNLTDACILPGVAYNDAEEFDMLDDTTKKAARRHVSPEELQRQTDIAKRMQLQMDIYNMQSDMDAAEQMLRDGPTY